MSDCIFCRITAKEVPSNIIYEDDQVLVLLDQFPASRGHTLVIPKAHCENIFDIPEDTAAHLQRIVVRTAKVLRGMLGAPDINVLQNNGGAAGQTVFHYHVHLIPRCEGDDVNIGWKVNRQGDAELAAYAHSLRNAFSV
ncbi:MAG: HIT family protein [Defluviitaleaceae bacterium]|nr:HIT family protein [Defluviitaleaceae bacterium]